MSHGAVGMWMLMFRCSRERETREGRGTGKVNKKSDT